MRKIPCPCCHKPFILVSDDIYIDFNLHEANKKDFCQNCRRKIRYSEKVRINKGK
jgi:hypothetical protein